MIWNFAQTQQQVDIVGNVYLQWGAVGVLFFGGVLVSTMIIRYLLKENKDLKLENSQLKDKRVEDAKVFAELAGKPAQDLVTFVGTLYELSTNKSRKDV